MMSHAYLPYLKTLRRIPAPIIRSMATREFYFRSGQTCLLGWAFRETLAAQNGAPAEEKRAPQEDAWDNNLSTCRHFADSWGGTAREWQKIYNGVLQDDDGVTFCGHLDDIEEAFARRVAECAR